MFEQLQNLLKFRVNHLSEEAHLEPPKPHPHKKKDNNNKEIRNKNIHLPKNMSFFHFKTKEKGGKCTPSHIIKD